MQYTNLSVSDENWTKEYQQHTKNFNNIHNLLYGYE